jgi:hypothetical protein
MMPQTCQRNEKPSPVAEIRERIRHVRSSWSRAERLQRLVVGAERRAELVSLLRHAPSIGARPEPDKTRQDSRQEVFDTGDRACGG